MDIINYLFTSKLRGEKNLQNNYDRVLNVISPANDLFSPIPKAYWRADPLPLCRINLVRPRVPLQHHARSCEPKSPGQSHESTAPPISGEILNARHR